MHNRDVHTNAPEVSDFVLCHPNKIQMRIGEQVKLSVAIEAKQ